MRIGIDIDNVISNFNDTLLEEYLKHDKELRNTGIVNENPEYIRKGMFDWTEQEEKDFYYSNIERIAKSLKPIYESEKYIQKLKEDGNEIYIITGRQNGEYSNPLEMTTEWLKNHNIVYDKLILTDAYNKHAKSEKCLENKIDIMIDDSTSICRDLKDSGINVLMMETRFNDKDLDIKKVSNWREIYAEISSIIKDEG